MDSVPDDGDDAHDRAPELALDEVGGIAAARCREVVVGAIDRGGVTRVSLGEPFGLSRKDVSSGFGPRW